MLDAFRHFPLRFDPIALTVGSFDLYWYAVCFALGLAAAGALFFYTLRARRLASRDEALDLIALLALGAVLGGRLGFVLFYAREAFWADPARLFLPVSAAGEWIGLSGMSFFGGLLGVLSVLWVWSVRRRRNFWEMADALALAAPIGLFFGRVGNFLNLELPGRPTTFPFGLQWPGSEALRHPVTLYEAAGEGLLLSWVLIRLARRHRAPGWLAGAFLAGYGAIRFSLEFFREPDSGFGLLAGIFTYNQILAGLAIIFGMWLIFWNKGSVSGTIPLQKNG